MFTYKTHNDEVNKELRSRIVTVVFTDGTKDVSQTFRFSLETTNDEVKKAVKNYQEELNLPYTPIVGDITNAPADPVPVPPTQAELDRTTWQTNWTKLKLVDELITAQVLTGTEPQVLALRKKVKDDFKVTYLG